MCYGCYVALGKPAIVNDKTRCAARLISEVVQCDPTAGVLYAVIEEWHLDDAELNWCYNQVDRARPEVDDDTVLLDAERECVDALLDLSLPERASALALFDSFLVEQ